MKELLALDPGVHACGFAYWREVDLITCGVAHVDHDLGMVQGAQLLYSQIAHATRKQTFKHVAIERMRIYEKFSRRGDQNDLLDIAFVSGLLVDKLAIGATVVYRPTAHEWKGTLPKALLEERVRTVLPQVDSMVLEVPKGLRHNAFDAVGIGLWIRKAK